IDHRDAALVVEHVAGPEISMYRDGLYGCQFRTVPDARRQQLFLFCTQGPQDFLAPEKPLEQGSVGRSKGRNAGLECFQPGFRLGKKRSEARAIERRKLSRHRLSGQPSLYEQKTTVR